MQKERQVIARVNAFLESNDWVNSPTAREILASYSECCVETNSRLGQCAMLLQKKMTVEAVNLAGREPSLFEIVPLLNFPRLPEFLELCDLYDWSAPPQLNLAVFDELKSASTGLSGLMELLEEYRRIARGRDLRTKIDLLRKIAELDPQNPEWRQNQKLIEKEFLPDLIEQAKSAIVQSDFAGLERLQKELTHPAWQIPVPPVVLTKVEKVLEAHHLSELKKAAGAILEEVNQAYGTFDQTSLDDALIRWNTICEVDDYEPAPNELLQIQDAEKWLEGKKRDEATREAFASSQKRVNFLLDSEAPWEQVEKEFAVLSAFGFPIPDYLADRVTMYREFCESEARHRRILRVVKQLTIGVAVLFVLVGIGYVVQNRYIETRLADQLRSAIESRELLKAQEMLADIEKNYPRIARGAKITELSGELSKLKYDVTSRQEDFHGRIQAVDEELKEDFPDEERIRSKLAECEELVYFEDDKRLLKEKHGEVETRLAAVHREADRKFREQVRKLTDIRADFFRYLNERDFANAESMLDQFQMEAASAAEVKGVSAELRKENAELLASYGKLRKDFEDDKDLQRQFDDLRQKVLTANTASAVAEAVAAFKKSLAGRTLQPSENSFVNTLDGDSRLFRAIEDYQENPQAAARKAQEASCGFFQDAGKARALTDSLEAARRKMVDSYGRLMESVVRKRLRMLCFQDQTGRVVSIYFPQNGNVSSMYDSGVLKLEFQNVDDSPVQLEIDRMRVNVQIGETRYPRVKPLYPANWSRDSLLTAEAPHQRLISETLKMLRELDGVLYEQKIIDAIRRIISDPYCNPYWKIQLCKRLVDAMVEVKDIDTKYYKQMKTLTEDLLAADKSGEGMENEVLNLGINSELARFTKTEMFDNQAANHFLVRLISEAPTRKLQFLGVIQRRDGKTFFRKSKNVQREKGEVWCFDAGRRGCWLAGHFQGDEISWDPAIRDRVETCVAFTPGDENDTMNLIANVRDEAKKAGVDKIPWPAFWPRNAIEGETR